MIEIQKTQNVGPYRDMRLLHEVEKTPNATQRDLSKRVGVALGLTNLMLRRLTKKGYIKILNTKGRRIRYLITPQGILEKSRLTVEFIQYSLSLYSGVRQYLRQQLSPDQHPGVRKILLCGTSELAEIASLTIQEMGLELTGVVDLNSEERRFLGHSVQPVGKASALSFDRLVVASLIPDEALIQQLLNSDVPMGKIVMLSRPGAPMSPLIQESEAQLEPV